MHGWIIEAKIDDTWTRYYGSPDNSSYLVMRTRAIARTLKKQIQILDSNRPKLRVKEVFILGAS